MNSFVAIISIKKEKRVVLAKYIYILRAYSLSVIPHLLGGSVVMELCTYAYVSRIIPKLNIIVGIIYYMQIPIETLIF